MATTELLEIVQGIMMEPAHEDDSEIDDVGDFCQQVGDWVSRLNAIATDDDVPLKGSKVIIIQAMEGDAVQTLLEEELEEHIDEEKVDMYLEALLEIKEMATNLHETFPRSFPHPAAETMLAY